MGKRAISILEPASTAVAEIAWFIESKGMTQTAKKFVNDAFDFFEQLSDDRIEQKPCAYKKWAMLGYRCVTYKKKYVVAYQSHENEIIICDFVASKLLR